MGSAQRKKRRSTSGKRSRKRGAAGTTPHQKGLLVGFGFAAVIVALLILEGVLHIIGYGEPGVRPDPFLGFERIQPLFSLTKDTSGNTFYATSPNKGVFFNHQQFAASKPPGTFRIFCFGGSSTYGRPYRCETAFPRWVEVILNSLSPRQRFEIINAGGISYASYRVSNLVEETLEAGYDPDLLIVYCGHNEFLEKRTYGDLIGSKDPLRRTRVFLERFRSTALLRAALSGLRPQSRLDDPRFCMDDEVDAVLDRSAGLDYYTRDDALHENIVRHYEVSLERIVEMAKTHGCPVLLVNVVYNLKDFSPFKSVHPEGMTEADRAQWDILYSLGCRHMEAGRPLKALDAFAKAADIDPRYAELQFRIGRCFEEAGDYAAAERSYIRAKDEDVCPLRAPEGINQAIERVASRHRVPLADLRSRLREIALERSGCPILGNDLFLDHVHLTVEGYQLMAVEIVECLRREGLVEVPRACDMDQLCHLFDEIEESLDPGYMAQRHLNLGKVLSWAAREEEAEHHFALAAELMADNAEVHYRIGRTHRETGHIEGALAEFRQALEINPDYAAVHNDMGLCYLALNDPAGAQRCFHKALKLRPDQAMPHVGLGRCHAAAGRLDRSIAEYKKAIGLQPDYADALNNLGLAYHQSGRFDEAEIALLQALDLYPDNVEVRTNLGSLYLDMDRPVQAEAEFRRAVRIKPDLYQAYGNLGLVLLTKGNRAGAIEMFRKVLELNPQDQGALELLRSLGVRDARIAAE